MNGLNLSLGSGIGSGSQSFGMSTVHDLLIHQGNITATSLKNSAIGDGNLKEGMTNCIESLFFSGTNRLMPECDPGCRVMETVSISFSNASLIVMIQPQSIFRGGMTCSNSFELFILSENVNSSSSEQFSIPGMFPVEIENLTALPNCD
jgi:hypothetical protein